MIIFFRLRLLFRGEEYYPAVKVGCFAVSDAVRGEGIGSILLDFIKAYFIIDNKTGCRFITVDAYRSAIPFL